MKLTGKSVVVTGASSGMGKAIVELFVKEGANVVAVARRVERLEALAESLKDAPGTIKVYGGDVSKREVNEGMIDFAISEFGKLDILVNNAGVMDDMAPMAQASDEKYESVMSINVYGPMAAMRKACQVFLSQGNGGNIINVCVISLSTSNDRFGKRNNVTVTQRKAFALSCLKHTCSHDVCKVVPFSDNGTTNASGHGANFSFLDFHNLFLSVQ